MPHLDAQALISDEDGLAFLASVLDVQSDLPAPRWLVEPSPVMAPAPMVSKAAIRRRRKAMLVPEAA